MKTLIALSGAAALLASAGTASAHHSYAMFDLTREVTVHGTVTALEWTNPHVWLWITDGAPGSQTTYGFETLSPGELRRFFGWQKTSLAVGEQVSVAYAPLRSGKSGGAIKSLTLADGRVFTLFRGPPSHPAAAGPPAGPGVAP